MGNLGTDLRHHDQVEADSEPLADFALRSRGHFVRRI